MVQEKLKLTSYTGWVEYRVALQNAESTTQLSMDYIYSLQIVGYNQK